MLFYCSIADADTGVWLGAVIVNRPSSKQAIYDAGEFIPAPALLEIAVFEIPVSPFPIPANCINRLLTRGEVTKIAPNGKLFNVRGEPVQ